MSVGSFSDFEPRPGEVRFSLNCGHAATAPTCRFRATFGLKLPLVETTSATKSTLNFGLCAASHDRGHWNSEAIVKSE